MKKIIGVVLMVVILVVCVGCEYQHKTGNRVTSGMDVQTFSYAYIRMGDFEVKQGYVTQWRDYSDSDVVQVMIDGKYYLTHYTNVVLIADPAHGNLSYSDPDFTTGVDE